MRVLGRWLLRPVKSVRQAAEAFERQHFTAHTTPAGEADQGAVLPDGRCTVGIHVRVPMFEFERQQVPCPTIGVLSRHLCPRLLACEPLAGIMRACGFCLCVGIRSLSEQLAALNT